MPAPALAENISYDGSNASLLKTIDNVAGECTEKPVRSAGRAGIGTLAGRSALPSAQRAMSAERTSMRKILAFCSAKG
jgi:hypothetical protein